MLQLRLRGQTLWQMEEIFARDKMSISRLTRDLASAIHTRWGRLLTWDGWIHFAENRMDGYVNALIGAGAPASMRLCAFIDGECAISSFMQLHARNGSQDGAAITRFKRCWLYRIAAIQAANMERFSETSIPATRSLVCLCYVSLVIRYHGLKWLAAVTRAYFVTPFASVGHS